jgi:hypothetical protein
MAITNMVISNKVQHGKPKHGTHKWQMKNKKKMVDSDVCVNVMAFNLCQQ